VTHGLTPDSWQIAAQAFQVLGAVGLSREKLIELAKIGRVAAQRPESRKAFRNSATTQGCETGLAFLTEIRLAR